MYIDIYISLEKSINCTFEGDRFEALSDSARKSFGSL